MSIPNPQTCTTDDLRRWLDSSPTRADLIDFLQRNDSNGCYTDDAHTLEWGRPATINELRACVAEVA